MTKTKQTDTKKETKYVPKNWTIGETEPPDFDEGDLDLLTRINEGDETVCWVDSTPVDDPALTARCYLIHAAPDMYAALKITTINLGQIKFLLDPSVDTGVVEEIDKRIAANESALVKAEGRE